MIDRKRINTDAENTYRVGNSMAAFSIQPQPILSSASCFRRGRGGEKRIEPDLINNRVLNI